METGKGQKFKAQLHLGHCEKEKLEKNTINNQLGKKVIGILCHVKQRENFQKLGLAIVLKVKITENAVVLELFINIPGFRELLSGPMFTP